jgi:hypothetical protein
LANIAAMQRVGGLCGFSVAQKREVTAKVYAIQIQLVGGMMAAMGVNRDGFVAGFRSSNFRVFTESSGRFWGVIEEEACK